MTKQWILSGVILAVLFGIVGIVRLAEYVKLKRMRALCCPECHERFSVPSLTSVRYWMGRDGAAGSGFYLHCEHCAADYRFADNYELVGREQKEA